MLIAESGASKISWRLIPNQSHGSIIKLETSGIRYGHTDTSKISEILSHASTYYRSYKPKELIFYCSGCMREEARSNMRTFLSSYFGNQINILVLSDLHAAARSTLGKNPGVCFILGTGSVIFMWDGHNVIEIYGGKGFPNGDYASGADLGFRLIQYLSENPDPTLKMEFIHEYGNLEKIHLEINASKSIAQTYGRFAPFLISNQENSDIAHIINQALEDFLNDLPKNTTQNSLAVIGSIGYLLQNKLIEKLGNNPFSNIHFEPSPIDKLVLFHTNLK